MGFLVLRDALEYDRALFTKAARNVDEISVREWTQEHAIACAKVLVSEVHLPPSTLYQALVLNGPGGLDL